MKYDVTYGCGCQDTVQLGGKGSDRESKLEWLSRSNCPACHDRKIAEASADLPTLTGSEKQVAWANKIRLAANRKLDALIKTVDSAPNLSDKSKAQYRKVLIKTKNKTRASWWIDNRDELFDIPWMYRAMVVGERH